jgi:hypothetical protein
MLMALMGLALASRLALGATVPIGGLGETAKASGPLFQLQAAMIICHTGKGHKSSPPKPHAPLLNDLLLFDQGDNAHALASNPVVATSLALHWSDAEFLSVYAACRPPLWRPIGPARGPPAAV